MRDATEKELQAMEASLNDAMDHGAIGLSLGLDYEPGMFAGEEELLRLMKVVAEREGIVTQTYPAPETSKKSVWSIIRISWMV